MDDAERQYLVLVIAAAVRALHRDNDLEYALDRLQRVATQATGDIALVARELVTALRGRDLPTKEDLTTDEQRDRFDPITYASEAIWAILDSRPLLLHHGWDGPISWELAEAAVNALDLEGWIDHERSV